MQAGESLEGSFQVMKLLSRQPTQWEQCVAVARLKFEKYFKRKVMKIHIPIEGAVWFTIMFGFCLFFFFSVFSLYCCFHVGPTAAALFPPGHKVKRWK